MSALRTKNRFMILKKTIRVPVVYMLYSIKLFHLAILSDLLSSHGTTIKKPICRIDSELSYLM